MLLSQASRDRTSGSGSPAPEPSRLWLNTAVDSGPDGDSCYRQATSKRSKFMTLSQAATKSRTKRSRASSHA